MTPEKALELASQYGIFNVVLVLILFFLGTFIIYVMRLQERRENKLFDLIEKRMKDDEERTNERHIENQKAMSILAEADRKQREEHEAILTNQSRGAEQHNKISNLLEALLMRMNAG